jgi:hypothetical protein
MKNLLFALPFFLTFLLQAQEEKPKDVEPTLQVTKAFEKDFPKIKPSWRIDYTGADRDQLSYYADFTVENTNMTAVYTAVGLFKVLEVEIKPADIPAKVNSYLAKNYPKNKINSAARVITNNNDITYEIGITIDDKWTDAIFNKEGDFLRMVQKDR